jgi:hypothetical protein
MLLFLFLESFLMFGDLLFFPKGYSWPNHILIVLAIKEG